MAGRGRTSFQKRQKEQMRLERRQQKEARKHARKEAAKDGTLTPEVEELQPLEPQQPAPDSEQ